MALIPASQIVDWTPGTHVGVLNGGIPTDRTTLINVTASPYNADNTGGSDASTAIQAAIQAASSGQVVYCPEGIYRLNVNLNIFYDRPPITLRGDGQGVTVFDQRSSGGIYVGSGSGVFPPDVVDMIVTAGLSKGSTTITVTGGSTSTVSVGQMILLEIESDQTVPVVSVYNYDVWTNQAPTNQMLRIVSKTSSTITFWPPLFDDYGAGSLAARIIRCPFQANSIGLEDFTVDGTNYTTDGGAYSGIRMENCYGSWVKNCESKKIKNYPIATTYCLNCEIRQSRVQGILNTGSNGAGILYGMHSSLCEDNILTDTFPMIEVNGGSAGNVIAYNYGGDNGMWDTNHAPHNQYNLYEGNCGSFMICDGYFGGQNKMTMFRNFWRHATINGMNLRRFNRNTYAIANVCAVGPIGTGLPNMGNGDSNGTAQLSLGDPWRDFHMTGTLTTRTDADNGVITLSSGALFAPTAFTTQLIAIHWGTPKSNQKGCSVTAVAGSAATITSGGGTPLPTVGTTIYIGPGAYYAGETGNGSYQEIDLDVAATLVKKGNHYINLGTTDPLGGDTVPDSLFRSSKPSYFGALNWPPYDPTNPLAAEAASIPAGFRFLNETPPPPAIPNNRVRMGGKEIRVGGKSIVFI